MTGLEGIRERVPAPARQALRWTRSWRSPSTRRGYRIRTTYDRSLVSLYAATGHQVPTGPFRGMRYIPIAPECRSCGGALAPRLLGAYEAELQPTIEEVIGRGFTTVVDIGCAEGYYAIGLARRLPGAQVFAFDADDEAQTLCAQMAQANGVADRVHVGGFCTPERLRQLLAGGAFLLCDCEGCELELINPALVPELATTTMLVELHDFIHPAVTPTMQERFGASHHIELIDVVQNRDEGPYREWLEPLPDWIRPWILCEYRDPAACQQFAVLRPKTTAG